MAGGVWRTVGNSKLTKGATMNLQLRQSYSFLTQLLFLAAVFVTVPRSYAAPQFGQKVEQGAQPRAGTPLVKLKSQAQQGDAAAQYELAQYYLHHGIPRDYKEAAKWFRAAADSGSGDAQNSLAVLYYKGLGVDLDYTEAARWLRLAARQGVPSAETNLASLYEQGVGLPLDYVAAYTWYSRAVTAGDTSGVERRSQILRLMTGKQIDEATSLLAAFSSQSQQQTPAGVGAFSLLPRH